MKKTEIDKKISELQPHKQADIKKALTQNNVQININLSDLSALSASDPKLAREYMALLKSEQDHSHKVDNEILALEKEEQKIRKDEIPHIRKYIKLGQIFAFIFMFSLVCALIYALYTRQTSVSITGVLVAGFLAIYHISGKKQQKESKKDKNE